MKWILVMLFTVSAFGQVLTKDTYNLYGANNAWRDSVTVRTYDEGTGSVTWQLHSTVAQDTLTSGIFQIEYKDIGNFWLSGYVWTDSVGAAPNALNTVLEVGLYHGTGGYPDSTGILWKPITTITANGGFRISVTDSTWWKEYAPSAVYTRWRETAAQRNYYNIATHSKRGTN